VLLAGAGLQTLRESGGQRPTRSRRQRRPDQSRRSAAAALRCDGRALSARDTDQSASRARSPARNATVSRAISISTVSRTGGKNSDKPLAAGRSLLAVVAASWYRARKPVLLENVGYRLCTRGRRDMESESKRRVRERTRELELATKALRQSEQKLTAKTLGIDDAGPGTRLVD